MKKNSLLLLLVSSFTLAACSASSAGLSFDEGYQTFHYKGKDYAITKQEVTEDSIQTVKAKFMEWPVVNDKGAVKETISLNNLYTTSSHDWVIGVQDRYYKVEAEKKVAKANRIHYQEVLDQGDEQKVEN